MKETKGSKVKINVRDKGARGERELANLLRDKYGYEGAIRGCQHSGGKDSPDVIVPNFDYHIECKRVQRLNVGKALEQSIRDSKGSDKVPIVMHRMDGKGWMVTIGLDEFMSMVDQLRKLEL